LCDEHSVERVTVMERQFGNRAAMLRFDIQASDPLRDEGLWYVTPPVDVELKVGAPKPEFYADLPQADYAEEDASGLLVDPSGLSGKSGVV